MNPDILDKILRAIIVFLHVEKLGCTNSSWKRVKGGLLLFLEPALFILVVTAYFSKLVKGFAGFH